MKMYVKMKELGPVRGGGRASENVACRSANAKCWLLGPEISTISAQMSKS